MIINFQDNEHLVFEKRNFYITVLKKLRDDGGYTPKDPAEITNDDFYTWLEDHWQIKVLRSNDGFFDNYITGLELTEEAHCMLLLRYK